MSGMADIRFTVNKDWIPYVIEDRVDNVKGFVYD